MGMGIDIVIPLGNGSTWNDNELRYALRGIELFMPHDKIYIVGRCPGWLTNVIHIPYNDLAGYNNVQHNIAFKTMEVPINGDFMFFNDDHFLLQPFSTDLYHHKGLMKDNKNRSVYYNTLKNTMELFDFDINDFDTHCPIKYNMTEFKNIMLKINWQKSFGFAIKSVYCNSIGIKGEYYPDCKINEPLSFNEISERTKDRMYFSIGNAGLNNDMKKYLQQIYPNKSRYETSDSN